LMKVKSFLFLESWLEDIMQRRCTMHSHSTIVGVITMLMGGA
jgi:hypothetical protein